MTVLWNGSIKFGLELNHTSYSLFVVEKLELVTVVLQLEGNLTSEYEHFFLEIKIRGL